MPKPPTKLTIVVDALEHPSTVIDDKPSWRAQLWEGNKTAGARPKSNTGIQANSSESPAHAVAFALAVHARRGGV